MGPEKFRKLNLDPRVRWYFDMCQLGSRVGISSGSYEIMKKMWWEVHQEVQHMKKTRAETNPQEHWDDMSLSVWAAYSVTLSAVRKLFGKNPQNEPKGTEVPVALGALIYDHLKMQFEAVAERYLINPEIFDYICETEISIDTPISSIVNAVTLPIHVLLPDNIALSIRPVTGITGAPRLDCLAFYLATTDEGAQILDTSFFVISKEWRVGFEEQGDFKMTEVVEEYDTYGQIQGKYTPFLKELANIRKRRSESSQKKLDRVERLQTFLWNFLMILGSVNFQENKTSIEMNCDRRIILKQLEGLTPQETKRLEPKLIGRIPASVIDVYLTMEAVAREYVQRQREKKEPGDTVGTPKATHVRKGHNHRFRTGPRDAVEPTYVWHFIPTMIINAGMGPVPYLFKNLK